jgi:hypothetical protein
VLVYGASHCAGQLGENRSPAAIGTSEENPKEWSTVLITALGSWGKPVPCGHRHKRRRPERVVYGASHRAGHLGRTGYLRP